VSLVSTRLASGVGAVVCAKVEVVMGGSNTLNARRLAAINVENFVIFIDPLLDMRKTALSYTYVRYRAKFVPTSCLARKLRRRGTVSQRDRRW
jgi:hypothetical protein